MDIHICSMKKEILQKRLLRKRMTEYVELTDDKLFLMCAILDDSPRKKVTIESATKVRLSEEGKEDIVLNWNDKTETWTLEI